MNQEQLRNLAYNCGAKPKTEGHMRVITGVYLSYEQLAKFAAGVIQLHKTLPGGQNEPGSHQNR